MKKSSLVWTLLLAFAVTTLSLPVYGLEAAAVIPVVTQAQPPLVNSAEPEKDAALEAALPDLFVQPSYGCVGDWQCIEWWGPDYKCNIPWGQMYGFCY